MGLIHKKMAGICFSLFLAAGISTAQTTPVSGVTDDSEIAKVNADYAEKVLPIFRQSCFACHGPQPLDTDHVQDPLAQKRMAKLIKRAKYQFPMFETFPYPGDDDPEESLRHLVKSMKKNSMPPEKSQKLFKMGQPLGAKERKIILDWARSSLRRMKPHKVQQ